MTNQRTKRTRQASQKATGTVTTNHTMEVKVEFPKIPQLCGEENLQEWKQILRQTLRVYGLIQYVDPGIAEPADPVEKALWEKQRAQVILLMLGSFNYIQLKLLNHGWDPDEQNPKLVYDLVLKAIPAMSEDAVGELMLEWSRMERKNYDSMEKYQNRLQFLRRRLKELDCDVGDNAAMWIVLNGIRDYDLRKFLVRDLYNKTLTWENLMLEISAEAAKETTRMVLVSLPRTSHSPKATPSKKEADVGPNGYPFHKACGKYHYGGDDRCFKLHPKLLRTKPKKNAGEDNTANNNPTETRPTTVGSPGIFQLQSGLAVAMDQ
jgi:hypothetical protein